MPAEKGVINIIARNFSQRIKWKSFKNHFPDRRYSEMTYYEEYTKLHQLSFDDFWKSVAPGDVAAAIDKDRLSRQDFLILLSPAAREFMDDMMRKAHRLTVQHFGNSMQLFTPLYLSDYCVNHCAYCSFSFVNQFPRKKLSLAQIKEEGETIARNGIRQILILTGESRIQTPIDYIESAVKSLKKIFSRVAIEINPLDTDDYRRLVKAGVDGLCVYQEVYNEELYKQVHIKGPKRDYLYRINAPERGCQAGMRSVNIGALLGLDDWRKEAYFAGMHAFYLMNRYPSVEVSLSIPRLRPHIGDFQPRSHVTDPDLMQILLAYRLFLPEAGLTLSTRERAEFRNRLIRLGVTKMSAGVSTKVGGYSQKQDGISQFEISDERSVGEIYDYLCRNGYQPQ
jgi:2-iminoacetate synthase